jgi:uncharacterized membrane-anchored protein
MNTLVTTAAHLFAPWQAAYSDSTVISTSVTTVHVVAIVFGAGLAIAADRATLRHARGDDGERLRLLGEIHATHRPVLIALALMFVSGAGLAAADIKTFVGAPVFWIKLGLVTLLLMNGVVLERTEASLKKGNSLEVLSRDRSRKMWKRLRRSAVLSIALWTATIVAGTALVNA